MPAAGWYLWRHARTDPEARLGAVWLLAMVVFLSCKSFKRTDYLLPAYPGAALLLGCAAERWYRQAQPPRRLAVAFGLAVALCAAGWVGYVEAVAPHLERERPDRRFAEEIRDHGTHDLMGEALSGADLRAILATRRR